jgi:hypothetical protein
MGLEERAGRWEERGRLGRRETADHRAGRRAADRAPHLANPRSGPAPARSTASTVIAWRETPTPAASAPTGCAKEPCDPNREGAARPTERAWVTEDGCGQERDRQVPRCRVPWRCAARSAGAHEPDAAARGGARDDDVAARRAIRATWRRARGRKQRHGTWSRRPCTRARSSLRPPWRSCPPSMTALDSRCGGFHGDPADARIDHELVGQDRHVGPVSYQRAAKSRLHDSRTNRGRTDPGRRPLRSPGAARPGIPPRSPGSDGPPRPPPPSLPGGRAGDPTAPWLDSSRTRCSRTRSPAPRRG